MMVTGWNSDWRGRERTSESAVWRLSVPRAYEVPSVTHGNRYKDVLNTDGGSVEEWFEAHEEQEKGE